MCDIAVEMGAPGTQLPSFCQQKTPEHSVTTWPLGMPAFKNTCLIPKKKSEFIFKGIQRANSPLSHTGAYIQRSIEVVF